MPLNPTKGRIKAVIKASHTDKLIRNGVQKLWSRRIFTITTMVNRLPNVPKIKIIHLNQSYILVVWQLHNIAKKWLFMK